MWQELTVGGGHSFPIYAMHIHVVEPFLLLFIDMVEHILTLGGQVHF